MVEHLIETAGETHKDYLEEVLKEALGERAAHHDHRADVEMFAGLPTDPHSGGPWVMSRGTPYAHIMIPVGN